MADRRANRLEVLFFVVVQVNSLTILKKVPTVVQKGEVVCSLSALPAKDITKVKACLTGQEADTDGAILVEGLHRRMLNHASVLSFILHAHILHCQSGGRQDPVTTL